MTHLCENYVVDYGSLWKAVSASKNPMAKLFLLPAASYKGHLKIYTVFFQNLYYEGLRQIKPKTIAVWV